jgi:hypothetical protein
VSTSRSKYLFAAMLAVLAARGLSPETMDPWRGWIAFKQFAREVAETPDPGVSVQIEPTGDRGQIRLFLLRQVVVREGDRLEPTGGVVCEFTFAPRRRTPRHWEAWSFDSPTFERFVDVVEQCPLFSDLMVTRPRESAVYWEDAPLRNG